jgi:Ser/Thr protein kinase RdoA (MazF antagonist)
VIRTLRSLVDPAALAELVAAEYELDVTGCVLLRSLVNDVYRIDAPDGPRILKVYRTGQHSVDDVAWELELAAVLKPMVAHGIRRAGGEPVGVLTAAEGPRPYAMWEWAPGCRPRPPFDDGLFRRFGVAAAWFHAAADDAAMRPRALAIEEALGRPYDELLPRLEPADRVVIAGLVDAARRRLSGLDLERGVCHGDLSLDNLHLDGDRIVFYDLDRSGWGRRAADLTGVASTEHWPAFLAGYRSIRSIADADLQALPWLDVIERVGVLHFHLVDKPLLRGTESVGDGWAEHNLERLRSAAVRLR